MGAMKKIENMEKNLENLSPDMFTFAEYDANAAERTGYSNYSYWASTWRVFTKNKVAMFFLTLLIALMVFTFIQPYLPGQKNPIEVYLSEETGKQDRNQPPSADYWFGTNSIGQDLWARIWSGTRTSLFIGLAVGLWDAFMGIIIGSLWGYVRKLDAAITEVYNVIHNIPSSIILILVSYLLKPSVGTIIFAMCLTGWLPTARFIRNQILIIRDRDYNVASRCIGTPTLRIVLRNLLPYLVSVIMLRMALTIPEAIGNEVFITYIGLGLSVETPSLGNLVNDGRKVMMQAGLRYQLLYPTLILSFVTIAFYLIGNAFSDAADPKNHLQ